MNDTRFSIITASLNSEKYIEDTILSVSRQTYKNKEHIIIDGGSTDSTLEIIKKYNSSINYWVSESDNGIADAMNKGISKSTGDYCLFINSDDYLVNNDILKKIASQINDDADIYLFRTMEIHEKRTDRIRINKKFGFLTLLKMRSAHQGQLISKKLFDRYGLYDESFKIVMDYDFILRLYINGVRPKTQNLIISCMRQTGISSKKDWPSLTERFIEERRAHMKNCPGYFYKIIYLMYWPIYLFYRKLIYTIQ